MLQGRTQRKRHEDRYDPIPKQNKEQKPKCLANRAMRSANDESPAIPLKPRPSRRPAGINVRIDSRAQCQIGKPVGKIARPTERDVAGDVHIFARNDAFAVRTRRRDRQRSDHFIEHQHNFAGDFAQIAWSGAQKRAILVPLFRREIGASGVISRNEAVT